MNGLWSVTQFLIIKKLWFKKNNKNNNNKIIIIKKIYWYSDILIQWKKRNVEINNYALWFRIFTFLKQSL